MKILFVAAEVAPIAKVGGLADVVEALPKALVAAGHDVRVLIPKYAAVASQRLPQRGRRGPFLVRWQQQGVPVRVEETRLPGTDLPLYLLDSPPHFAVFHGVYFQGATSEDTRHELERFTFFAWAVASLLPTLGWRPDVVHCHDWHAAGVAVFGPIINPAFPPTVLTIHNLQNQGRWEAGEIFDWLGLAGNEHPGLAQRDNLDNFNFLQQGIWAARAVNTVSPTYAHEILTPEYGEGLEDDLRSRPGGVRGILNGIDTEIFNPATDRTLAARYSSTSVGVAKEQNKAALQSSFGWPVDGRRFLIGSVGRLTPQKGYDLLVALADALHQRPVQVVLLGTGLSELEVQLRQWAARSPSRVRVQIGFDPQLAQRIYAGADAFLMPSRFEPCGLGQMIAMRYGTLPIVRATGGLRDTVIDLITSPDSGTGFRFIPFSSGALLQAIDDAAAVYRQAPVWQAAVKRALAQDFSWRRSARDYLHLYAQVKG
ncbi:MAG: glycogen synthase [Candidatus Kerfeldbacteria bacterium]|nr:glycogen synthase [Candidatus Kerfeldbacteria bacterium]